MPASLDELFEGDFAIAQAWLDMLTAAGLSAFQEFSDEEKTTPYVEVQLEQLAPTDHRHTYTDAAGRRIQTADQWRAMLVSRVCTVRGKNSDQQQAMVRKIRAAARAFAIAFNADVVPLHGLNSFLAAGVTRTIGEEDRLDKTELRFAVHFGIRPNAWLLLRAEEFALQVVERSYQLESGFRLWNADQRRAFGLSVVRQAGLETIRIANVGVDAAEADGSVAFRHCPGSYRFRSDGTFQLWNPDQSLFHTVTVAGGYSGEEVLHVAPLGEAIAVEPPDGSYLQRAIAAKYRFKESGAFQLWNAEQQLWFTISLRGSEGFEQLVIDSIGERE